MAELFADSGMSSGDLSLSPPSLSGVYIPSIDKPIVTDGFGLYMPLGGGGVGRNYSPYGISAEGSAAGTQLRDLSNPAISVGGGISYNFEGLVGPQGPSGPPGPAGLSGVGVGWPTPNGLFALSSSLQQIEDLGTKIDQMIYTSAMIFYYTWTEKTPLTNTTDYRHIACDSDMSNIIVAGYASYVWTSSDQGDTWTKRTIIADAGYNWGAVASDADGSVLMAAVTGTRLYLSTNSGVSWAETQPAGATNKNWNCLACDSDGSVLVAAVQPGRLYVSTDGGGAWVERQPVGDSNANWIDVDCDSDGSVIVACGQYSGLWRSADSGATWTEMKPIAGVDTHPWTVVACNGSGSVIVAATAGGEGDVYMSEDGGINWSNITPTTVGIPVFYGLDVSDDGNVIFTANYNKTYGGNNSGYAYVSFNRGTTWTTELFDGLTPHQIWDVALAGDGSKGTIACGNVAPSDAGVFTSVSTTEPVWSETTITEFARTLVDDVDATEMRATLGLSLPLIVASGGTGLATLTDHGLLLGSGTDAVTALGSATNGQIPIGSTGADPTLALLTAGTGIGVANAAGSITISSTITQYTDEMVDDRVASLIQNGIGLSWTYSDLSNTLTGNVDLTLDEVGNLAANKTFNNGAFSLSFNFTNPTNQPTYDGAFEIQASGAFTGDLFHVHQHTGNPGTTDLCHFEAEDADVTILRLQHSVSGGNCLEIGASGAIKLRITNDGGLFILERTADLADVAGFGQLWVRNDTPNNLCFTDDTGVVYELSHNLTTDIDHDALTNFVADEHVVHATWAGTSNITTLGTIATGVWNGTDIAIADGGTGQGTAQLAINALTAVSGATNEHVLTKDTATGNAVFKAATGGASGLSHVSAYLNTNQTVGSASWTTIQFNTEDFDTQADYNTGTYTFTAPVTGYYNVSFVINFLTALATGKILYCRIFKNNATQMGYVTVRGVISGKSMTFVHTLYLAATDTIVAQLYQDTGGNVTVEGAATGNATILSVDRLIT